MSYSSGEAAEQVVRMTLNGVEVAAKISGKAAERLAVLLYAVLQDQKKTRGKTRLTSMLKSGKELKVFSVSDGELERFCREAKKYGVLYCVLKDKTDTDGHTPSPNKEEAQTQNPTEGPIAKSRQSEPTSKPREKTARGTSDSSERSRPSVREQMKEIREEQRQRAASSQKTKDPPQRNAEHIAEPKKKKENER